MESGLLNNEPAVNVFFQTQNSEHICTTRKNAISAVHHKNGNSAPPPTFIIGITFIDNVQYPSGICQLLIEH